MNKAPEPLPIPSRRELTLAMTILLVVGGFAISRGGNSIQERGSFNVANERDKVPEVAQTSNTVDQRSLETEKARPAMAGAIGFGD